MNLHGFVIIVKPEVQEGILVKLTKIWLNDKKQAKLNENKQQEKTSKLKLNSQYGLLG